MKKKTLSRRKLSLKKTAIAPLQQQAGAPLQAAATFNCWRTLYNCKA